MNWKLLINNKWDNPDINGDLAEYYFKIFKIEVFPINAVVFGYSAICPFAEYIIERYKIFPNVILLGISASGKSRLLRLMVCHTFGNRTYYNADSLVSIPRLEWLLKESNDPIFIDDIDELPEPVLSYLNTMQQPSHLDKNGVLESKERIYTKFTGSANISLDIKELRFNRSLFYRTRRLEKENQLLFDKLERKIEDGNAFGYYVIECAKELFKDQDGLIALIDYKRPLILKMTKDLEIDQRKINFFTYIYVGLMVWDEIFFKKGFRSENLKELLNLESGLFLDLIKLELSL